MKKNKTLLVLGLLSVLSFTGCQNTTSHPSSFSSQGGTQSSLSEDTSSQNNDPRYQIYLLAQQDGYEGTYEEWLASIAGKDGKDGADGKDGTDGLTPYIGENGNWWIGDTDTQISAKGKDGENAPHAGEKCTVTFNLDNGVMPEGYQTSVVVDYGSTLVLPIPTRADASYFEGWFTGNTVNDGQFFNYTPICTNLTLTARWAFTRADLENGAIDIVSPIKDVYHSGEVLNIAPKTVTGKTFSKYTFDILYNGSTTASYSTKYYEDMIVGRHCNFQVEYINTPSTISPFAGTYIGTYHNGNNEEVEATIIFDGYGLYYLNDDLYSLNSYSTGNPIPYSPDKTDGYLLENQSLSFFDASFISEEKPDGLTYTYIQATSDILEPETVYFWLNGEAYVEEANETCKAAGTYTASVYDSDLEDYVTYVATIDESGAGLFDESDYIQTFTVTDDSDFPNSFTILTEADDENTITLQADGTYKGRFGEAKSANYTFDAYVFPFTGTFVGVDSNDTTCKLVLNRDKTGTYYEDDYEQGTVTVVDFDYPNSVTIDYYGDEIPLTLQTNGTYKGRIGESSVAYTFTQMTKCPYAGTFTGEGSDFSCELVVTKDFKAEYYEDGYKYGSYDVIDFAFGTDADYLTLMDEYEETYKITKMTTGTYAGKYKVRIGSGTVYCTFTAE